MDGAVVVLYNPTITDYQNLKDYSNIVDRTIIIDNSSDDHLSLIQQYVVFGKGKVIYEHYPENIGLCEGMNRGIRRLKEEGCSWVLTMDQDSHFRNSIVYIFRKYVNTNDCHDIAIIAPQYEYDRNKKRKKKANREIKWSMLSGNYVNTEVFLRIGGFKKEFFVDGLDIEYCLRARKMGYRIIESNEAVLIHSPASTREIRILGKTVFKYGIASSKRYYYQARACAWIVKRYKDPTVFLICIYKYIKILLLFANKKEYLKEYHKGIREGIKLE
ncbi:MAG: glycosyltransferase [Lachnospiraceae bacterium]|nr:glycosyltransferase [Lachnospiraceae bacterium]